MKKDEFDDYISTFTTEVSGKNTNKPELEDESEEIYTTVCVKTTKSRKQIQYRKNRNENSDRGITYITHQGKVLNDKKTMEESDIEAETTIEMSLRLLGGMEKVK